MSDLFSRKEVLFINWTQCPKNIKDNIADNDRFSNDILLPFFSEFEPFGEEDYANTLTMKNIEEYWRDQTLTNNFQGTLEDFIGEYNLEVEIWLIKTGVDLKGVKKILFNICW